MNAPAANRTVLRQILTLADLSGVQRKRVAPGECPDFEGRSPCCTSLPTSQSRGDQQLIDLV
jgi:hypothetical protein